MSRAQVDCIACHKSQARQRFVASVVGQTFKATQESCNYCHGTKYDGALDVWKRQIAGQVAKAEAAYDAAKKASDGSLRASGLLDDATQHSPGEARSRRAQRRVLHRAAQRGDGLVQGKCQTLAQEAADDARGGSVFAALLMLAFAGCEQRSERLR
jgi:hypothetical protein